VSFCIFFNPRLLKGWQRVHPLKKVDLNRALIILKS